MPAIRPSASPAPRRGATIARFLLAAALAALAACSDGSTAPDPSPTVDGPSAYDLVDSALARGEIDAETALLQKVYAALGDPRLDDRFDDPLLAQRVGVPDPLPSLLRTAAGRLPTLSPAAQRALAPYFQPPRYVGSAWTGGAAASAARASRVGAPAASAAPGPEPLPQEGWTHVDAPGIPVRVWSHPDYSAGHITPARVIAELQDEAWPKLTALMGRTPLSDEGVHAFTGTDGEEYTWGDGGDGRFDVYLIEPGLLGLRSGGVTVAYPPGCGERPGFMLLRADLNEEYWPLGPSLAHEFFHALQFAFAREVPCDDEWDESTAQWASYYVYPRWSDDPEDYILSTPDSPLHDGIGYWKWLFNAYLQHAHSPSLVRATYERYASAPSAMHALDAALPGGLRRHWAEFAVHAWNDAPGEVSFVGWEGVATRPRAEYLAKRAVTEKLDGAPRAEKDIGAAPGPLTRKYNPLGVTDDAVRWLEITNPYAGRARPRIALQAWVKIRGADWKLEDWSSRGRITFCRTRAAEKVDSLILVQADYTVGEDGSRPNLKWEARDQCPDAYSITVREWTTSEEYGKTYDVSYTARIATPPDGSSDLVGTGTYEGTIITHKANCHNGEPDNSRTFNVEGRLEASGGAEGPDGWFSYVLATVDWLFVPFAGRLAETQEERDAVRGLGTVGSALRPLQLQGGAATRTDTLARSWSDCTGQVYTIRTTSVSRTGGS